jgi:hypothetical protein
LGDQKVQKRGDEKCFRDHTVQEKIRRKDLISRVKRQWKEELKEEGGSEKSKIKEKYKRKYGNRLAQTIST